MKFTLYVGLILPYLSQLGIFIAWSNFGLKSHSVISKVTRERLEYALASLCSWFLLIELRQLTVLGKEFF